MKKLSRAALAVASCAIALAPVSAFAYLSPEQVFGDTNTATYAPPTQREGEDVIEQQQREAAERRAAEQQALQPDYAEPVDTYVPDNAPEPKGLFDQEAQYERRQDRIEESHGAAPTIIIGGDGTVVDSNGNVLHSGAPRVASTGPESVLAIAAMILAGACTYGYMSYRSRALMLPM